VICDDGPEIEQIFGHHSCSSSDFIYINLQNWYVMFQIAYKIKFLIYKNYVYVLSKSNIYV
jgi:hypothetical protein